jgi:MSHA biogenesis protein MshK
MKIGWRFFFASGLVLSPASGMAAPEKLPDPTLPAGAATPATPAVPVGFNQEGLSNTPQLQSILVSPERRLAIIDGQTLRVGERFGDSVLVKINESEVVLNNGKVLQILRLFPLVVNGKSQAENVASPSKKDQ